MLGILEAYYSSHDVEFRKTETLQHKSSTRHHRVTGMSCANLECRDSDTQPQSFEGGTKDIGDLPQMPASRFLKIVKKPAKFQSAVSTCQFLSPGTTVHLNTIVKKNISTPWFNIIVKYITLGTA